MRPLAAALRSIGFVRCEACQRVALLIVPVRRCRLVFGIANGQFIILHIIPYFNGFLKVRSFMEFYKNFLIYIN
jgi:hypothetical protein